MKLNRDVLRKLPLALRIEIEENAQRKPLTQSELAAEQQRILAVLRKLKAPGTRTDLTAESTALQRGGLLEKPFSKVARATAIVGKLYGESHKQLEKRLAVVEAAEAEPQRFGKLAEDMDRTGRVDGPYKRLKVARQAAAIRAEPPPYPDRGPYRVAVADVPWPAEIRAEDCSHRAFYPYATMTIEQICAEAPKVRAIMHEDAILWFWTTNFHMRYAYAVLDAWDFEAKTILTWVKDRFGYGDLLRNHTEHCILATRGKPTVELSNQTTVLNGPMRAHSQKPDEFYTLVESLCPAPRFAYLFARNFERDRWDSHGDEALPHREAAE
jgi:N6-adenosine-specific RNA methylase IME4